MKNKLPKTLLSFIFSMAFIMAIPFAAHADEPSIELIESPDGNILKIHNVINQATDVLKLETESDYDYEHAIVTGKMCRSDFLSLHLIFSDCKSIDLSGVDTDEIPNGFLFRSYELEKIVLPANLKRIGAYAFLDCCDLKIDKLPESLEYIGCRAFVNCHKLQLTIPDKVLVGKGAFSSCSFVKLPQKSQLNENIQLPESDSHEVSVVQSQSASKSKFSSIITYLFSLFTKSRIY